MADETADSRSLLYTIRTMIASDTKATLDTYREMNERTERDVTASLRTEIDKRGQVTKSFQQASVSATASAQASLVAMTEATVTRTRQLETKAAQERKTEKEAAFEAEMRQREQMAAEEEKAALASERRQHLVTNAIIGPRGLVMGLGMAVRSFGLLGFSQDENNAKSLKTIFLFEGVVQATHALSRVTYEGGRILSEYGKAAAEVEYALRMKTRAEIEATGAEELATVAYMKATGASAAEAVAMMQNKEAVEAMTTAMVDDVAAENALATSMEAAGSLISTTTVVMGALVAVLGTLALAYYTLKEAEEAQKKAIEDANKSAEQEIALNKQRLDSLKALAEAQDEYNQKIADLKGHAEGGPGPEGDLKAAEYQLAQVKKDKEDLAKQRQEVEQNAANERQANLGQFKARQAEHPGNEGLIEVGQNASAFEALKAGLTNTLIATGVVHGVNAQGGSEGDFAAKQAAIEEKRLAKLEQIGAAEETANKKEREFIQAKAEAESKNSQKHLEDLQKEAEAADKLYGKAREAAEKAREGHEKAVGSLASMEGHDLARLGSAFNKIRTGNLAGLSQKELEAAQSSGLATGDSHSGQVKAINDEIQRRGQLAGGKVGLGAQISEHNAQVEKLETEANELRKQEIAAIKDWVAAMNLGKDKEKSLLDQALGVDREHPNAAVLGSGQIGRISLDPIVHQVKVTIEANQRQLQQDLEKNLVPMLEKALRQTKAYHDLQEQISKTEFNKNQQRNNARTN